MEKIRAFIALNLPVATINRVAETQKKLRRAAKKVDARVGWVPAANMHVTLKFLGEIDAENIYAIRHRLGDRLAAWPAVDLSVKGLGVFPESKRPRVLWAGLGAAGAAAVGELAEAVEETLDELGFAREERPFHPHLTLARIKQLKEPFWANEQSKDFGEARASEVVLYRSVLSGKGAEYKALARFPLVISDEAKELREPDEPAEADDVPAAQEAEEAQEPPQEQQPSS